jgi:N6-adenosine-specific RNA methylase IME4
MEDIFTTQKKYQIIYADPPWAYNKRNNLATKFGGGANGHYDVMKIQDIQNLPISRISDENCALFMWTTFPKLLEQVDVFKFWGFHYVTLGFSWIKIYKKSAKPCFGIGYYTKSNCEVCLLGIKGKMKPISNAVSSCVISERREHSRKPDEVRDRIVQLLGNLPRIELFARQKTQGWDCWGNDKNLLGGD